MTVLKFDSFDKHQLIEKLKTNFPDYKIQNSLGTLQVRTSGFTVTGNVKLDVKPKTGIIKTSTNYDMVAIFILCFFPMGIYIYLKKEKQKKMENEVIEGLKKILTTTN